MKVQFFKPRMEDPAVKAAYEALQALRAAYGPHPAYYPSWAKVIEKALHAAYMAEAPKAFVLDI